MYSEQSESRENAQARGAPCTRVSFRVLLSRDFSRLPQMESLLTGYLESFIFLFFFIRSVCAVTREVKPSPNRKMIKRVTVDHYDIFAKLVVE